VGRSGVVEHRLGWTDRAGRRWLGGQAEVLKNGAAGVALGQDGEDAHRAAAGVADQNVGGEHALQQGGPVESTA
jgi:hypothetical protein